MNAKTDKRLKGNILYFQSGGPTAVINSSFTGLFEEYQKLNTKYKLYVSHYGISGLLNDDLIEVDKRDDFKLDYRPGAYFGSVRKRLPKDKNDPLAKEIIAKIKANNIRYIFPNGGNDSMDTCLRITEYLKDSGYECYVIGIPKTIDNDLYLTDHTPGYGSACKYIANCTMAVKIDDLSYRDGKVNIIEVMGRDSGYLTASSKLASLKGYGPDFIYVPEVPFDLEEFLEKTKRYYAQHKHCLIVVSEGIRDKDGQLISASKSKDVFGNSQLGGVANYLSSLLMADGIKSRAIELSVVQRAATFCPSKVDIEESKRCGRMALRFALRGNSNKMVAIKRISDEPYKVEYVLVDIEKVATVASPMPLKYINKSHDNINASFIKYASPLIKGEGKDVFKDGLMNI